jgi:hypothetical protein
MEYKLSFFFLGLFSNLVIAAADNPPAIPLPQRTGAAPVVDGRIATNEYAYTFQDAKTGIRVSWQADQERIYVGLVSPAKGWVAMGFGHAGMWGTTMVIGYVNPEGKWTVQEQMGKIFYGHGKVNKPKLTSGVAGIQDGHTVMEFSLPLALSNGKTIQAGQSMPFVLAGHDSKTTLSKHSFRTYADLTLEPANPLKKP